MFKPDKLVAVVVAHFHPRKGNRIEWQHPKEFDADGVEFKSIASGFHESESDFVFFRHAELFALACFHRLPTDSAAERDVRMRSVAVFAHELAPLQVPGLAEQLLQHARRLNVDPSATPPLLELLKPHSAPSSPSRGDAARLSVAADAPQLVPLVRQMRSGVMTLWKALLLRRRVMLYATPPVGVLCERALAAHKLLQAASGAAALDGAPRCDLLLYVGLNDEQQISQYGQRSTESARGSGGGGGFVACTTDALFAHKPELWDLFVDADGGARASHFDMRGLALSARDEARYSELLLRLEQAERAAFPAAASDAVVEGYFRELSDALLHGLEKLADDGMAELLPKHLKELKLGEGDATFVRLLAAQLGHAVTVKTPRFRCC